MSNRMIYLALVALACATLVTVAASGGGKKPTAIAPPVGTEFVFTLMDEEADTPLVEQALANPESAGLQRVRIADFGVQLETGTEYQWSIAMSAPGADHSKDVISVGWIDYVGESDGITARLEALRANERADLTRQRQRRLEIAEFGAGRALRGTGHCVGWPPRL